MNIKNINFKRMATGAMAALLTMSIGLAGAPSVSAAEVSEATIHPDRACSLTLYKYDFTGARKDGVWDNGSYTSTGIYDANVNEILGNAVRKGAEGSSSALGNGESSNGYAISGVEYSYLKVADAYQFSQSEADGKDSSRLEVLYAFDKTASADLLTAIGLPDGAESDANANALPGHESSWFYRSDVINKALANALNTNSTVLKNDLERFIANGGGVAMPLTDNNGKSTVSDLPVGLYLLVETAVPEMVTDTTNPFFVALPMTSVNGGGNDVGSNTTHVTDGGHNWIYDVTIYPKNETGILSLEKTVREAQKDGGKNNASDVITDGFAHNATASTGDTLEYQIVSTLPTITSKATSISTYNFYDTISAGLTYNRAAQDVKIEFFTDKGCTDKIATWVQNDGKFTVNYSEDGRHMTVDITEAGLNEINGDTSNVNGKLYCGYSNYTARVTYTATLNSSAVSIIGDSANQNKVVLTWKRTSSDYYDTLIDDCHVYTYGLVLEKQFSDMNAESANTAKLFEDVKFKIFNNTDKTWVTADRSEEGIYYVTGHVASESEASVFNPVTVNGKHGQLVVKGLEDDEYIITEIETADHYTLLKDNIKMVITAEDDPAHPCQIYTEDILGVLQNDPRYAFAGEQDLHLANIPQRPLAHNMMTAKATIDGNKTTMITDGSSANAMATLTVINTRGFDLPQTGDNGARQLPIAGAVIAGAAMVLGGCLTIFFIMKKKEQEA